MPTYSKIPMKLKGQVVVCGSWAVFARLVKAVHVASKLERMQAKRAIPLCGYIKSKGEKIYYVRYGLLNDPAVYTTK